MTLTLKVRNILGIAGVDLPLDGITLVAGLNRAGKSSLIEACAAVVTGTPLLRGSASKKDAGAAVLRDGSADGYAVLANADGRRRVAWPSCDVTDEGAMLPAANPLAVGAVTIMSLDARARVTALVAMLGAEPTVEDIIASLRNGAPDESQLWATPSYAGALMKRVSIDGWDATYKAAKDYGAQLKGRWKETAGTEFGAAKAASWCPQGIDPDDASETSIANLKLQRQSAEDALQNARARQAVSRHEAKELEAIIADRPARQAAIEAAAAAVEARGKDVETAIKARQGCAPATDLGSLPPCPHCGKKIVVRAAGPATHIEKPPSDEVIDKDELGKRRKEIAAADGRVENRKDALRKAQSEHMTAEAALAAVVRAEKTLAGLAARGGPAEGGDVKAAEEALTQLTHKLALALKLKHAREILGEWRQQEAVNAVLAPNGARLTALQLALGPFNERLAELAAIGKWPTVALDEEGGASFNGRPYRYCSESERWRVDLTLSAALAEVSEAPVLLVDRLDVIDPNARGGVLALLKAMNRPALVAMTAKDRAAVPNLAQFGMGRSYWADGGTVVPLTTAQKEGG